MKSHEILDPACKYEVHNKNVFEHWMHDFFDSRNLESTPASPTANDVPPDPTLLVQLSQDTVDAEEAAEVVDRLSEEDTLVQWVKEARLNRKPSRKRLKKGP